MRAAPEELDVEMRHREHGREAVERARVDHDAGLDISAVARDRSTHIHRLVGASVEQLDLAAVGFLGRCAEHDDAPGLIELPRSAMWKLASS